MSSHLATMRRALRTRIGELVVFGGMALLLGITGWAAYGNVRAKGWNADAAAWAQAAGSIMAIAGAIWLSRSETRQARRTRREQAEEAIWSVRFVIVQAQYDSQIVAAELTGKKEGFDLFDVRSWKQRSTNASLALATMLGRTEYIHSSIVLMTCNAKVLVDGLSSDLDRLEDACSKDEVPGGQLLSDIAYVHANLSELLRMFDARVIGINKALDRGRDMLPLDEWARHANS